jgi:hypothetical protein
MLESLGPLASATGYHCFYVIGQIQGTGRAFSHAPSFIIVQWWMPSSMDFDTARRGASFDPVV